MTKFNIVSYLYSLPANTRTIDIRGRGVYELPNITRFANLEYLFCDDNYLISLPTLPKSLLHLSCNHNKLVCLPALPENLQHLFCSYNQLSSLPVTLPANLQDLYCMVNKLKALPTLPPNLRSLYCISNELIALPELPVNLQTLHCSHNMLTSMPMLPESIQGLGYMANPFCLMLNLIIIRRPNAWDEDEVLFTIKQINTYNSFRDLYYCLKFKRQFRNWLWEKVRKPKTEKKYHPDYLINNLNEDIDLDRFLDYWITVTD